MTDTLQLFIKTQDDTLKKYDTQIIKCLHTHNYDEIIKIAKKANDIQNQTLDTLIF